MRPLRRKKLMAFTRDPQTGNERLVGFNDERDILSDQGEVGTYAKQEVFFNDCGCGGPPVGRCFECQGLSCA
ncbi:MAG: hypothetical protein JW902_08500, partial [Syntrophaceae bacterium]|nr:hypothetical protein [Syntrophaceae bacterium]